MQNESRQLSRSIGTIGLIATGISSMIGASIYIVPFMIQKNVPGIGSNVIPAFLFASLPALFAAFAYAILSSAIHRAGGSYVFVSRILHPYWGFIASFSQWFGLSIVIGVVAYMAIPFFGQAASALDYKDISQWVQEPVHRLVLSLILLWLFIGINILGLQIYQPVVITLVIITFLLAGIVIIIGWTHTRLDFYKAVLMNKGIALHDLPAPFDLITFLSASGLLFASFIGFDSIAQAGGEAKNPSKNLPKAIIITFIIVTLFYLLFTFSVYRLVPWSFMLEEAEKNDISATSLF
ncbi:MAG: APC family permease, partial [Chitinophagaceae bacterium]